MHLEAISIVSSQHNDNNICQNLKYIIAVNKLNMYVLITSVSKTIYDWPNTDYNYYKSNTVQCKLLQRTSISSDFFIQIQIFQVFFGSNFNFNYIIKFLKVTHIVHSRWLEFLYEIEKETVRAARDVNFPVIPIVQ